MGILEKILFFRGPHIFQFYPSNVYKIIVGILMAIIEETCLLRSGATQC